MNIPYASRSKFITPFREAILTHSETLDKGQSLTIFLEPGGYSGYVMVTIDSAADGMFGTDWNHIDATRFPARIKAAATASRDCGKTGCFVVFHESGTLTIQKQV